MKRLIEVLQQRIMQLKLRHATVYYLLCGVLRILRLPVMQIAATGVGVAAVPGQQSTAGDRPQIRSA